MSIGQRIKERRLELGLTQKQLGELCGMADSAVRKYESGKITPKHETLCRIASALNASEWDFYDSEYVDFEVDEKTARYLAVNKNNDFVVTSNDESLYYADNPQVMADLANIVAGTIDENEILSRAMNILRELNFFGQIKAIEAIKQILENDQFKK